jgi:hypothetical protein
MDKVHKAGNLECYIPSSEPFRFYTFKQTLWLLVLKQTILIERHMLVGEVSVNFCG